MRYLYSVVRFVPDPARGEFVNVGVIAGSDDSGEWDIRAAENLQRARHLDDPNRRSLAAVTDFMERLENQLDEHWLAMEDGDIPWTMLDERWLWGLHRSLERVIQVSAPTPIRAESAQDAATRIFEQLVIDPIQARLPYLRKTRAAAALRFAYRLADLSDPPSPHVFEKVRVHAGPHASHLDFAVANGEVVQLAQTWSFQVPDQKQLIERVRSWGWTMERLRVVGGQLSLAGHHSQPIDRSVDLEVVYVPPAEGQEDTSAYEDALGVFNEVGAIASRLGEEAAVAQRAAELLHPVA